MPPQDTTDGHSNQEQTRQDILDEMTAAEPRNPDRITDVLDVLEAYWEDHPDLRLGQILTIVASDAGHTDGDPFYLEDNDLERILRRRIDETN